MICRTGRSPGTGALLSLRAQQVGWVESLWGGHSRASVAGTASRQRPWKTLPQRPLRVFRTCCVCPDTVCFQSPAAHCKDGEVQQETAEDSMSEPEAMAKEFQKILDVGDWRLISAPRFRTEARSFKARAQESTRRHIRIAVAEAQAHSRQRCLRMKFAKTMLKRCQNPRQIKTNTSLAHADTSPAGTLIMIRVVPEQPHWPAHVVPGPRRRCCSLQALAITSCFPTTLNGWCLAVCGSHCEVGLFGSLAKVAW